MKRGVIFVIGLLIVLACVILYNNVAMAETKSGNYDGVDWSFDSDTGVFVLGKSGETQTFADVARSWNSWPWYQMGSQVTTVIIHDVVAQGSLMCIFNGFMMTEIDLTNLHVGSAVTDLRSMFHDCRNLQTVDISGFDTSSVTEMMSLFQGCSSLTEITGITTLDVSNVQNSVRGYSEPYGMFKGCSSLVSLDLSGWDTGAMLDMGGMFSGCTSLFSLDISNFDTSNVTNMDSMFSGCKQLTSLNLSHFDTSSVTTMASMFYSCSELAELNMSGWSTSHVVNMVGMFNGCSKLESINVADFDTSSVTNMGSMFYGCSHITELSVGGWNVSNVTNMDSMFYNCGITTLDLSEWNTSSLLTMSNMFYNCSKLTMLDVSNFDTSHVAQMTGIFMGCSGLTDLDVSHWDTSSAISMEHLFHSCSHIISLNLAGWDTAQVKNMGQMFCYCKALTELLVADWDTSSVLNMSSMFYSCESLPNVEIDEWDTSRVTNMSQMFSSCGSLTSLNINGWTVSNVTNMERMFEFCDGLIELDLSAWDISSVTNLSRMFAYCETLRKVDVAVWDTSNVTNLGDMFSMCKALVDVDVSNWNTSRVTVLYSNYNGFSGMFNHCESLKTLDLHKWDVSRVSNLSGLFGSCSSLESLNLSGWDLSNVTHMSYMFTDCSHLKTLDISGWNMSHVNNIYHLFSGCQALEYLDLSGWNMQNVSNHYDVFSRCNSLKCVLLDQYNPFFFGTGSYYSDRMVLPTPPLSYQGVDYTGKWIREDGTMGPYTSLELQQNYNETMAGRWIWEKAPTEYRITFVCTEDGYTGAMPQVTVVSAEDYTLPGNAFKVFGYEFDHWTDGTRRVWMDHDVIPANTYQANAEVTLTAVFEPQDRSINMQDGAFEFSIQGDEKALFEDIPAGTSYQVYEQLPEDWVLIYQENSTGLIYPLEESMAIFLNKYQPDITTVQFTGRKLYDDQPALKDQFEFELWEGNILLQTKSTLDGGFFRFDVIEFGKNDVGTHHYTIKEKIGTDNRLLYDGYEEQVTVEIYTEPGDTENVIKVCSSVTYSGESILFKNWTKPGELTLEKLVDELLDGHQNDEFRFRITFKQENGLPLEDELTYSIEP